ncbi:Peptidase C14, p20 domain,Peptidase C14A, caspase catalytic domain,CARD domain,Caspase-like [Cinara cedri]|uniref:Peptidase C14, p20 domain,Peptidase C14A, caspase catalytic domain,CARD domain,Caspase-like n=1 Tax=Cinara cedri TaxID=506608 RepID=A0A5E4NG89_9HEMI|nr:Peptidase C14, p20 domain,Peptidase C14A, caspase catalytic domain,CARD domain,Caspase-like [Cinara cedri]
MEKIHRQTINNNLSDLINATNFLDSIVDKLLEINVINSWMKNYIKDPTEESIRKLRLYQLIQGRGPRAFSLLCKTLEETSNINARNILLNLRISVQNPNDSLITRMIDMNLNNSNSSLHDEPYVKIHPNLQRMDIYEQNLPTGAYPMGSNPKGHALILNINKIKGKDDRIGSDVDVENLQKLFHGLGYVIQLKVDGTDKEIKRNIDDFINTCHNTKSASIVVFIMSHGEAGNNSSRSSDVLTSDGIPINTDWIIEKFGPDKISSSVPKLFFIQACRGNNIDFGWKSFDNENNRVQNDAKQTFYAIQEEQSFQNRRYENVFIAYATVPGYNAKRDCEYGSWFVQKFCEVVRKNAWKFDLDTMMKMVDIEIRNLNCEMNGFQTPEWSNRGFNKKFYFNPGLYDDNSEQSTSQTNL